MIEKTMGDFLAHQAGCLHCSSIKDDVTPTLCRSKGRWDKDLEEEYTKDYMETASRYFVIRIESRGVLRPNLTNAFPILSHSITFPGTHCWEQDNSPEKSGTGSHPYVLSLCLNKTLSSKDFVSKIL